LPPAVDTTTLQTVTLTVALVCWGLLVALWKVNRQVTGPAWWAAAMGATAASTALVPLASGQAVAAALKVALALGGGLAALEGMLRFRGRRDEGRRWRWGAGLVVAAAVLGWPWSGAGAWPARLLDLAQATCLLALALACAWRTPADSRSALRLAAAFCVLLAAACAGRAAAGLAPSVTPDWWLLALLLFCVGFSGALLLTCYARSHARVRALATQDLLTSLANRRQFDTRIAAFAERAGRGEGDFSLAFINLDGVKEVNALLGRDAGDAMLVEFARRLRRALRSGDVAARTGGHEFAALLPGVAAPQVLGALATRLRANLEGPLAWQGHALELRCRLGAATWGEAQGRVAELQSLVDRRVRATAAAVPAGEGSAGPWVSSAAPIPPRPPSARSRASDRG
jgi:diguanylate cyclase (GGDEF)-like protein